MSNAIQKVKAELMPKIEASIAQVMKNDKVAVNKFMKHAGIAFSDNPKLYNCTPKSLVSCLVSCATYNLFPDKRNAYLVPYGNNCTFIIGYMGLIQLLYRSTMIKDIITEVVYESDEVSLEDGLLKHKVKNPFAKDRGEMVGVYAKARLTTGGEVCAHMTVEEVEAIRQASPGKNSDPWKKHYPEMMKKTVVRRLSKMLPIESEIVDALNHEDSMQEDLTKPQFDSILEEEAIDTTATASEDVGF